MNLLLDTHALLQFWWDDLYEGVPIVSADRQLDACGVKRIWQPCGPPDAVLADLLPDGPKRFPDDFVDGAGGCGVVELPGEPVSVLQEPDGQRSLLLAYERHCGNRAVAEHQAKRA